MNIEGQKVNVKKSAKEIFDFFSKPENYEQLMPSSIEQFVVKENSFTFRLSGMPEVQLAIKDKTPYSEITLGAVEGKLDFSLTSNIHEFSENNSEVSLTFKGNFNPMMAMMVKKPLTKFIDTLTENISKL